MLGSAKQVALAEKIKKRQLGEIGRLKAHPIIGRRLADPTSYDARALAEICAVDDAATWIRRQHNTGQELLRGVIAALRLADSNAH